MRKIKFRAWIDDEELCNEEEILYHLDENENFIPFMQDLDSWYFDDGQTLGDYFDCFDKEKIMQYTGLKDKTGKEIYEGDILQLINEDGRTIKAICRFGNRRLTTYNCRVIDVQCYYFEVEGRKTNPIVKNYCGKHDLEIIEIIGNIFENSELLEGD